MNIKKLAGLAVTTLALNMIILSDASAVSIDVKCETRGTSRSKISIDGKAFGAGIYRARAQSGTAVVWSKAFQRPVAGQIEFDYDSNPADIRAGATAVSPSFIKNNRVTGNIYSFNSTTRTYTLRASVTDTCKAR